MLATIYLEADYPDIHRILESGILLTRFIGKERLSQVREGVTNRDYFSKLAYQTEAGEEEIVRVNGLNRANITYLAKLRTNMRSLTDNGEHTMDFGSMYGNILLAYDPAKYKSLGVHQVD